MSTVLLIPGLAADERMWRAQHRALSAWTPTRVATEHKREARIEDMAERLLQQHTGPLVLCGASMGGMIAMEMARQSPQRIRGLALLGTVAHPETAEMHALRTSAIELFEQGRAEEIIRANVPLAFDPVHAQDPLLSGEYLQMVLDAGAEELIRHNRAVMARPDARPHLANLKCPVLVVCGESDQLTPLEHSRVIAERIPQAELNIVRQAGHMLTMEQPEVVSQLLGDWIRRLPA